MIDARLAIERLHRPDTAVRRTFAIKTHSKKHQCLAVPVYEITARRANRELIGKSPLELKDHAANSIQTSHFMFVERLVRYPDNWWLPVQADALDDRMMFIQ